MLPLFEGAQLVDAGLDWLTVTAKEAEVCERLLELGADIVAEREDHGFLSRSAGFQGYTGCGVDGCFIGRRADGICLRLSGSTAHRRAADIAPFPVNITRIDLQITVQFAEDPEGYAYELLKALRSDSGRTHGNPQRHSQLIDAGRNGSSVYLGKRSASFYGRIYDKGRESAGRYPIATWRVESECKRKLAPALWSVLAGYGFQREAIIALMRSQWRKRGVDVRVPTHLDIDEPVVPRGTTDVDRRIAWLARVAQPVVRTLHETGYEIEAASALYGWMLDEQAKSS